MPDPAPTERFLSLTELGTLGAMLLRERGITVRFTAHGHSMAPTICNGAILTVQPCRQIRRGEVALVAGNGLVLAHRVTGRTAIAGQPYLILHGDAQPLPDRPVPESWLLGQVVRADSGPLVARAWLRAISGPLRLIPLVRLCCRAFLVRTRARLRRAERQ